MNSRLGHATTDTTQRSSGVPALFKGIFVTVATLTLVVWGWGEPLPDPVSHRVFLIVLTLAGITLAACVFARDVPGPYSYTLYGVRLLAIGMLVGTAVGTFPWSDAHDVFWYQLWWGGALATALALNPVPRPED
ncbi:hypothetical protein HNR23_004700 [Nocardiopsis mwathae]|uniref:Uncharacterized protein n=1 Tax=Nocardiopsis mwathae TaxID=1472723 RepID=A0A7W9YM10_9ACTN|nr:hypothetical protein [Nocardiopsis mwathae]MBB6174640.1 hypothetical protein [Nocardiopsis mwathae]